MIRVLLAEDMHMIRAALTALLRLEPDIDVVAEVTRGDEIVPAALAARPDVAVLDIDLPGRRRHHRRRLDCASGCRVPGAGAHGAGAAGPGAPRARGRHRGVPGQGRARRPLADAIRRTAAGLRVLDPELVVLGDGVRREPADAARVERAEGGGHEAPPAEETASRLHLSPGTVRNYLTGAITKTGARNKIDAIRIAQDAGWL